MPTAVVTGPVVDGDRIFLALRSAHVVALDVANGHELWRIERNVSLQFAAADGLVFIAAGDAVEALRAADGASAWVAPRLKAAAPLVVDQGLVFVVTDEEIVAIAAKDGAIAWRQPAGGVKQPPAFDGDRVYLGANDGRIVAMDRKDGTARWEWYVPQGVTAIHAGFGRVYAGAGEKLLYCLDARNGRPRWPRRVGALITGRMAVDADRVYISALDNVVYALDRENGNQRWKQELLRRPIDGVRVLGHVVFVPVAASAALMMFYDHSGAPSGVIPLPGETPRDTPPAIRETERGLELFVVTGGLSNEWKLTHVGPAGEPAMVPFASLELPGAHFLTDPALAPLAQVLPQVFGDPVLKPVAEVGWPIRMQDPPLVPLTILPGLQLRALSPVLPPRRGG